MKRPYVVSLPSFVFILCAILCVNSGLQAQVTGAVAGQNINMVSGTGFPGGDPYLQRQNEPSMAVSTRNPQHLLAGANDYRSVDIPFPNDTENGVEQETGDAWVGVFTSLDGGKTWVSTLLPGFPQDQSQAGMNSPLQKNLFKVATDPTVRAGTHGLFYFSGLAFDRGNNAPSAVFVSTFQDQNNKGNGGGAIEQQKNGSGSPFLYINTTLVDTGNSGQFLDKPWIAVDVPRTGTSVGSASCSINGKAFTSGNAYVFYTSFNGSTKNPSSAINVVKSGDCGATWSKPVKISQSAQLNQGTVAAIDPGTGTVYVFWRQIGGGTQNQPDAILYASSTDGGGTWTTQTAYTFPAGNTFDESSDSGTFREADLPTVTVDGTGRVWLAFSQRNLGPLNTSRILVTTLPRGGSQKSWTKPFIAENNPNPGHQFMPAFAYAYGKLMLIWFDNRDDHTKGVLQCPANTTCKGVSDFVEMRVPLTGSGGAMDSPAQVFGPAISDTGLHVRHTIDVRGALVDPTPFDNGSVNSLAFPSVRISQYTYGSRPCGNGSPICNNPIEQQKFNPPNFPMFSHGTKPFIGDYIDVTALTIFFDPASKQWIFNTQPSNAAVFHATWTDNRDVRPPPVTCNNANPPVCTQDWAGTPQAPAYTPTTTAAALNPMGLYQQGTPPPACMPTTTGSRNQNAYTADVTEGLLVGVKENTKPLTNPNGASVQRAFSVFARNTTNSTAYYRFTVTLPNPIPNPNNLCATDTNGTTASFFQTIPPAPFSCVNFVDVIALPRSTVSRSLFVNSTLKFPSVNVTIAQINQIGGQVIGSQNGGLQATTAINPDNTNPDITNPDITNPDITNPDITNPDITNPDIINFEVYDPTVTNPDITNPDITNPDITNPDITNPDITNPDITNPDITNVVVTNPDITNPDITNPDITNPDITNPDITNPDITNPDITNLSAGSGINDVTFKLTNKGNTSASYSAKEFAKKVGVDCAPLGSTKCQLIVHKTYPTPIANACRLTVETQNIPISNVPNPAFTTGNFSPDNGSDSANMQPDATVSVGPGEGVRVTLRVFGPVNTSMHAAALNDPQSATSANVGVKTVGIAGGADTGKQTPATSLTITTLNLPVAVVETEYQANSGGNCNSTPPSCPTRLTSVGGVGATSWSTTVGTLPTNISLATNGQLSGVVAAAPGAYPLTFRVDDSQTPTTNFDLQNLSIDVNQLSISSIVAANTNTGSIYLSGNPGDSITVKMMVSNQGPAAASSVVASPLAIMPVAAGTPSGPTPVLSCSSASGPSMILSNSTQEFDYTCTTSGGNGFVTFTANATARYVNSAASVPAVASPMTSNQITVDTTPPTLNFGAVTPTPNAAGWNNTVPVTVNYMTNDNLSGVASSSPSAPVAFANQGPNQTTVVTVFDKAGNKATFTTPAVSIDTIAPVITAVATPAPNAAGWNNTPVTVTFNCVDNVVGIASGVATVTSPITLRNDGKNQSASGTCTDIAGNSANVTASGINIDRTIPPVAIAAPTAGQSFVLNSTITPMFTCGDGSVDVVTCTVSPSPGPYVATPVGAGSFTVSALDQAGNANQASTNYLVVYNFTGFQSPLQPAGPPNAPSNSGAFTLGSAIPVQLLLQDANGSFITDPSALTSVVAYPNSVCTGAPDGGAIPLYQNGSAVAPSTFAVSAKVYTLTWNTNGAATACYNIVVTLKDTTQHATIVNLVTSGTATQFADGVFNNANWSSAKVFDSTPSSSATFTATQVGSGGNPNEYRQVNMTLGRGSIIVGNLNPLAVYTPATQGAIGSITYSYDVREFNPPFAGAAVNYALLLLQNGTYYVPDPTDTFSNTGSWMNVGNANLTAAQFSNSYQGVFQLPGAGPLHPDFSASGAPITFGYFSASTNTGAAPITTSSGIDNWSVNVSPFMNVSGSEITGFYAANGAFSSAPNDLSTTTVSAFVPNGTGGFNSIAGVGKADGTFSILNLPAGFYWLQLGNQWLWTSEAIIDAGSTSEGRANAVHANTTVNFAVSGMSPWQSSDSLEYWTPNVYEVDSDIGRAPATGATSYIDSVPLQGLIDTSQGDVFYLMHLGGSISGNYTIDAMEDIFSPSGPIMETPGSVNNFSGSFTQLAQNSTVHLAVNASQFAQFAAAAGPGATLNSSTFGVFVTTPSQELLFGNVDPALFEFFRTDFGGISSDFDLGDEHYGDPFPLTYVRYYLYEQDFLFPFMSPGATLPGSSFVVTQAITLTPPSSAAPLLPVVGPVSSVAINGTPFTQAMSAVGTTPTIRWQAPTVGSATDYRIAIFQLGVNANGRSTRTRVATLSSTATNVQIPPGILKTGSSYLLEIVAVHRAGFDGQANLFKTKFPYGISQIVTYQLAP